jgi:uncharacterized phage protein (TIGR01671 family)
MSRQIKFRGLTDTQAPTWVYGSLVNNLWTYSENSKYPKGSPVCEILVPGETDCWEDIDTYEQVVTVLPDSVGQFTGLQDKAGRDIYEGDIVRFTLRGYNTLVSVVPNRERIGNVFWQDFRSCWAVQVNEYANQDLFRLINNVDEPAEVIGNIYESPHLLNQSA